MIVGTLELESLMTKKESFRANGIGEAELLANFPFTISIDGNKALFNFGNGGTVEATFEDDRIDVDFSYVAVDFIVKDKSGGQAINSQRDGIFGTGTSTIEVY